MQEKAGHCELVSALADGQLRGEEFSRTVEWLGASGEARSTWHLYHLVGDVMRSGEAMASTRDAAFLQRLKLSLRQEAPLSAGVEVPDPVTASAALAVAAIRSGPKARAANGPLFDWKMVAGVASLALVSVIGWQAWSGSDAQRGVPLLVQAPRPVVPDPAAVRVQAVAETQVLLRDPQLDALLAAHRQFGGTSALQLPTGFLRNATFEGAGR